jgi:hypothetical protein
MCFFLSTTPWAYWGSGGIAPHILDLGTRSRWVVSFTPWLFYPQRKSPWYPSYSRLGGPRASLDAVVKRKVTAPAGTGTPDYPVHSPVLYHWAILALKVPNSQLYWNPCQFHSKLCCVTYIGNFVQWLLIIIYDNRLSAGVTEQHTKCYN